MKSLSRLAIASLTIAISACASVTVDGESEGDGDGDRQLPSSGGATVVTMGGATGTGGGLIGEPSGGTTGNTGGGSPAGGSAATGGGPSTGGGSSSGGGVATGDCDFSACMQCNTWSGDTSNDWKIAPCNALAQCYSTNLTACQASPDSEACGDPDITGMYQELPCTTEWHNAGGDILTEAVAQIACGCE